MIDSELIKLIGEYVGEDDLTPQSRLYHDLGIYGDDADELLERYARQFGVSFDGFVFKDYFPCEGDPILPAIWRFITGRKLRQYKSLTIADLQRGIETKVWR